MSGHVNGLHHEVLEANPHTLHVHCYAQVWTLFILRALTVLKIQLYLSALNEIAAFTSHWTKRTYTLIECLKSKIPFLASTRWSFSFRLMNVIEEHKVLLLQYFRRIEEQEGWSANDRMAAIEYKKFLKKFQTVFILERSSAVFTRSDICFIYCKQKVWTSLSVSLVQVKLKARFVICLQYSTCVT
jgi:hypothetical protein